MKNSPKYNPFISIGAHGIPGMDIRVHIISIDGGITPEIKLEKREPPQCKALPKGESIYLIRQNGWKINPFISIGAYGGTGLGIRVQFLGIIAPG